MTKLATNAFVLEKAERHASAFCWKDLKKWVSLIDSSRAITVGEAITPESMGTEAATIQNPWPNPETLAWYVLSVGP